MLKPERFPNAKVIMDSFMSTLEPWQQQKLRERLNDGTAEQQHVITVVAEIHSAMRTLDDLNGKRRATAAMLEMIEQGIYKQQGVLETSLGLVLKLDEDLMKVPDLPPDALQPEGAPDGDVQDSGGVATD